MWYKYTTTDLYYILLRKTNIPYHSCIPDSHESEISHSRTRNPLLIPLLTIMSPKQGFLDRKQTCTDTENNHCSACCDDWASKNQISIKQPRILRLVAEDWKLNLGLDRISNINPRFWLKILLLNQKLINEIANSKLIDVIQYQYIPFLILYRTERKQTLIPHLIPSHKPWGWNSKSSRLRSDTAFTLIIQSSEGWFQSLSDETWECWARVENWILFPPRFRT